MKKVITIITLFLIVLVVFTGCSKQQLLMSEQLNSNSINKIQVITAMGNPDFGAESKIITNTDEIETFVKTFNSGIIGNKVDEKDIGIGSISYYKFFYNDELIAQFTFNVNDTNVIWFNNNYHYVTYGQNLKTPFELYKNSSADIFVVDEKGNII
ncbi:hypothetical protein EDC18_101510 [Natranaerovirga pectinivora]|uniref:Lipoprotein n=1 Tax=Natranaerovirga pectinivora TaxID=682400 RepID=A0A4R3MQN4_9FIRM|nr:hypothetical protein [Natranaerovirga pectinivora]TCT17212.1 hypothetical protein EDC18_101510 [Natranaerovirga pectinivora]